MAAYRQVYDYPESHLWADCQGNGISSVPNTRNQVWDNFLLKKLLVNFQEVVGCLGLGTSDKYYALG